MSASAPPSWRQREKSYLVSSSVADIQRAEPPCQPPSRWTSSSQAPVSGAYRKDSIISVVTAARAAADAGALVEPGARRGGVPEGQHHQGGDVPPRRRGDELFGLLDAACE